MADIKLKDLVGNEIEYDNIKTIKIPKATQEQEGEVEYAEYIQLHYEVIPNGAGGKTAIIGEGENTAIIGEEN